jgi:hypothetical protein
LLFLKITGFRRLERPQLPAFLHLGVFHVGELHGGIRGFALLGHLLLLLGFPPPNAQHEHCREAQCEGQYQSLGYLARKHHPILLILKKFI